MTTHTIPQEFYADGVSRVHFIGGMARLDFMTLQPMEDSTEILRSTNLRIIMPAAEVGRLRDVLSELVKRIETPESVDKVAAYNPGIFSVSGIEAAKRVILTPEGPATPEERWRRETPALLGMMKGHWKLGDGVTVVDYGCGIGRLAKELCALGCKVVGVDISQEMRRLAVQYVDSFRFSAVSPEEFVSMLDGGFTCDYACAVWVLQHSLTPDKDISLIARALRSGGSLFVVNNKYSRALPVSGGGWKDDHIDIWKLCGEILREKELLPFPPDAGIDPRYFQCAFYDKI